MWRASRHRRELTYVNTSCFLPRRMPELWQSDSVDFLAGNILRVLLPGAARPRDLHYKKAHPIRLLVNPAEWYRRVKAEAAISVNGTLRPAIGILIRLRSFSPHCCMRDTASPAAPTSALERALFVCHHFKCRHPRVPERPKASDFFSALRNAIGEKNSSVAALRWLIAWYRNTECGF